MRRRVVSVDGVGERPSHQVGQLDLDVKRGVGLEILVGGWENHDRRDHVVVGWNFSHNNTIARTLGDLLAVGESLASTEVNEVSWISFGVRLTSSNVGRALRV